MKTINDSKLDALGKQFPWFLVWFLNRQTGWKTTQIKDVRVERTDLDLCQRTTKRREVIGVFDQEGTYIGTVGANGKKKDMTDLIYGIFGLDFSLYTFDHDETVEAAILRLEACGVKPYFLVSYTNYSYTDLNNQLAGSAVIYKPKGESLPEWLRSLRDNHAGELTKKLQAIG